MPQAWDPTTWTAVLQVGALLVAAAVVSWIVRHALTWSIRRAARRAVRSKRSSIWIGRHVGAGDATVLQRRSRQRADALARLAGRAATSLIVVLVFIGALDRFGVDLAVSISSAGFLGFALALSGQGVIRDLIEGTRVLIDDRYALGDRVTLAVGGASTTGVVEELGSGSIRLRLDDDSTWYARHDAISSVTNHSRPATVTHVEVPATSWPADTDSASRSLTAASNDVGLTGLVFLGDLASDDAERRDDDVVVPVTSNRPMTRAEHRDIRQRLIGAGRGATSPVEDSS